MYPSHIFPPATTRSASASRGRPSPRDGFALILTLLILCLLIIVVVSYLASMSVEQQTSDAFTARARAAQAAQTGVESATAILAESFRDFPDSVTAWDSQQTPNTGTPANPAIVGGTYNEGTSLYMRAVAKTSGANVVANPLPNGLAVPGATPMPANDPSGNNPDNPSCENFVLPLISGVPGGNAQLVTNKGSIFSTKPMNLAEPNPVNQNWTDLNVRRFGPNTVYKYGDLNGVIGSPPDWTGTPVSANNGTGFGPKPARAYWVNLTGSNGLLSGRYAFWIDDESFRANVNYAGMGVQPGNLRADNSTSGTSVKDASGNNRSVLPSDMILWGDLASIIINNTPPSITSTGNTADPINYASQVIATRTSYPLGFQPERLALLHSATTTTGGTSFATDPLVNASVADALRYLTTTQSGSLNLTRHGSQRLNLNAPTTINPNQPVTMAEIRKLVEAIRFHLPNFGQRFYRSTNPDLAANYSTKSSILNNASDVTTGSTGNAEIYLYKTAANLRDYIDTDHQPTMIARPVAPSTLPTLAAAGAPVHPFGGDGVGGNGLNFMWAQGKEDAPFLQEAMVRYRPTVTGSGTTYSVTIDYYTEFWNMSDHDVSAADLGHNPFVRISNPQSWMSAYIARNTSGSVTPAPGAVPTTVAYLSSTPGTPSAGSPSLSTTPPEPPSIRDFDIDIGGTVYRADNISTPINTGVVFKAGTATVITTDPDCVANGGNVPVGPNSVYPYGGHTLGTAGLVPANVYYCPNTLPANTPAARRTFQGSIGLADDPPTTNPKYAGRLRGIMPDFRGSKSSAGTYLDYEVEVTLGNDLGYIDCGTGAFCISAGSGDSGGAGWDYTYTPSGDAHNDYLHGGTLGGNTLTPSELGDPRTNNEQLNFSLFTSTSYPTQPDTSRYGAPGKSDSPPFSLGSPNSLYVKPAVVATTTYPWPDYFDWPSTSYPTASLTAANAPSVIANSALTSIGQLGDLFDPARVIGNVGSPTFLNSRGGGRTYKIGQRDDRFTYDASGNAAPFPNTIDNIPASNGWASWRLTDVFSIDNPIELPARVNINGVTRDGGAALRAALTGFDFQPTTSSDWLIHGAPTLNPSPTAQAVLKTLPTDTTGVSKLVTQITNRLALAPTVAYKASGNNTPWGPFFERGEFGELENDTAGKAAGGASIAIFGKNAATTLIKSTDLAVLTTGTAVDLNHTFDRGREELFRRLVEMTCTRGDTFTVYAVGQSLVQSSTTTPAKITGTQRMRVTFRLVPKKYNTTLSLDYFHPGYTANSDGTVAASTDFDPGTTASIQQRFSKPDRYDVQILEVSSY